MLLTQNPNNKSITVSVLGEPNVGKSSLINNLLGFDLTAVTHKPQTTRQQYHCAFTIDHTEVVLVDTPGLHNSSKDFNNRLNLQAIEGSQRSDLNWLLIDLSKELFPQFMQYMKHFETASLKEVWVLFTKSDLITEADHKTFEEVFESAKKVIPQISKYFVLSSQTGENIHLLTGDVCDKAEYGPHRYEDGSVSNKNERFFVEEYIREQAFLFLKEELPYELGVCIDQFKDMRDDRGGDEKRDESKPAKKKKIVAKIDAQIFVNRPSQRPIVVGNQGSMIKKIGTEARKRIEEFLGGQILLNLHVKVNPGWFKNHFVLNEMGLGRSSSSSRVWRKK